MKALPLTILASLLATLPLVAQSSTEKSSAPAGAAVQVPEKNVSPDEAEKLVAEKKVIVVDVRTPEEYDSGHIEGAVNINIQAADFAKKLAELDQTKPVLVHCAAGGRSTRSLPVLKEQKFPAIYHMNGGFKEWTAAGKPVVKTDLPKVPQKK